MRLGPRQSQTPTPKPYVVPPSQEFDGNDGDWSTFKVSVGTPGQDFQMLPSTKSGQTFVVFEDGCLASDPEDCPSLRGLGVFNGAQSMGFLSNTSSTWSTIGQYEVDLESALNYTASAMFGYDKVSLGAAADSTSTLSLDKQVVGGVPDLDYFLGHIPLGVPESSFGGGASIDALLPNLRNQSLIPSLSFAYTAGAKYRLKSVFGQLIIGGYDSTRFKSNTDDFSFTFSTDASRLLTVGVGSITATNTLKGTYSLSSGGHFSLIDSTVSHLWLPRDICDSFEAAFGLTYDESQNLYLINSTMRDQLLARDPSVTIKLVNSLEDTSSNYTNIVLPYSAFDLQISWPFYSNATNYFPIRRAANDTQYTLGRVLLQEAYLMVDYERGNFTVAQTVWPDPFPAANIVTIQPSGASSTDSSSSSGLGTGAIAGIAAGGGALILAVLIGFFFFWRRRRRTRAQKYELANTQISESASLAVASPAPYKASHDPQELSGTPLTELASPARDRDNKPFLSANDIPQELSAQQQPQRRWQEVSAHHSMSPTPRHPPSSRHH
ncbi:acid protease [Lentithecium fluviatile CBS 122367]|uniref:Acid protease n=1 Tax=Lentithecium fluviatile CBS 122367 TaxID=1168545 RepID=A0A6G1JFX6_9PLEO|nr:acid protease [Lentithecium fluviatile CBS 122367]